jgi:hypothetical protein
MTLPQTAFSMRAFLDQPVKLPLSQRGEKAMVILRQIIITFCRHQVITFTVVAQGQTVYSSGGVSSRLGLGHSLLLCGICGNARFRKFRDLEGDFFCLLVLIFGANGLGDDFALNSDGVA